MKYSLCAVAGALAFTTVPLFAAPDTAYQALRTVGTERGNDALQHVIEVDGYAGVPQPVTWRVTLEDQAAAGGVRVVDVSHGKIVAEHTPVQSNATAAGAAIDFHKLNLDSAGAFTVAEKEAQKAHVGFDSVDYTLHTGDATGGPVWVIHMMEKSRHSVGTLTLAADTGVVVGSNFGGPQAPVYVGTQPTTPPDTVASAPEHDNVYAPPTDAPPAVAPQDDDSSDTQDTHGLRVGHRIKEALLSAGSSLKNFVTGKSGD